MQSSFAGKDKQAIKQQQQQQQQQQEEEEEKDAAGVNGVFQGHKDVTYVQMDAVSRPVTQSAPPKGRDVAQIEASLSTLQVNERSLIEP
jgi:hypothetical protein